MICINFMLIHTIKGVKGTSLSKQREYCGSLHFSGAANLCIAVYNSRESQTARADELIGPIFTDVLSVSCALTLNCLLHVYHTTVDR